MFSFEVCNQHFWKNIGLLHLWGGGWKWGLRGPHPIFTTPPGGSINFYYSNGWTCYEKIIFITTLLKTREYESGFAAYIDLRYDTISLFPVSSICDSMIYNTINSSYQRCIQFLILKTLGLFLGPRYKCLVLLESSNTNCHIRKFSSFNSSQTTADFWET